jgi:hypothetical protein
MSMTWTRKFVKLYINWTFCKETTIVSKVLTDWMEQGLNVI